MYATQQKPDTALECWVLIYTFMGLNDDSSHADNHGHTDAVVAAMQGPGMLGAPASIAALRHLKRLVLDKVVLDAQVGLSTSDP
jgi:hypothetical protein